MAEARAARALPAVRETAAPAGHPVNRSGEPICGARLRKKPGRVCQQTAGHRTVHRGSGKCHLHGGIQEQDGRLKANGRYSLLRHTRITERLAEQEQDADPTDLIPDIRLARGLTVDHIHRYEEFRDALLGWWASFRKRREVSPEALAATGRLLDDLEAMVGPEERTDAQAEALGLSRAMLAALATTEETRPRQVVDLEDAVRMLDRVTAMVERHERIRGQNALTYEQLQRFLVALDRSMGAILADQPGTLATIRLEASRIPIF